MNWNDIEDIALALYDLHGDLDPLTVRFTDLHDWVLALREFEGDPKKSNEKILEAVQMAWYEEWKEDHGESPLVAKTGKHSGGLRPD